MSRIKSSFATQSLGEKAIFQGSHNSSRRYHSMIELVKKAMFTGIGMMSLTKDKVEEVAQDFIEKGKMSKQEGEKFVSDLLKRSEESKKDLKKQVEESVSGMMGKMDIASKSDVAALREELAEIKAKLEDTKK
jgi:polyhydroxyalkanoate synthesis regulator phasin